MTAFSESLKPDSIDLNKDPLNGPQSQRLKILSRKPEEIHFPSKTPNVPRRGALKTVLRVHPILQRLTGAWTRQEGKSDLRCYANCILGLVWPLPQDVYPRVWPGAVSGALRPSGSYTGLQRPSEPPSEFSGKDTEAQREKVSFPRLHSM